MSVPDDLWTDRFRFFEEKYPEPTDAGTVIRGGVVKAEKRLPTLPRFASPLCIYKR